MSTGDQLLSNFWSIYGGDSTLQLSHSKGKEDRTTEWSEWGSHFGAPLPPFAIHIQVVVQRAKFLDHPSWQRTRTTLKLVLYSQTNSKILCRWSWSCRWSWDRSWGFGWSQLGCCLTFWPSGLTTSFQCIQINFIKQLETSLNEMHHEQTVRCLMG